MEQITTICYGKKDTWQSREEAQVFFLKAMAGSEGSEQERYATIYTQLCLGMTECRDEVVWIGYNKLDRFFKVI